MVIVALALLLFHTLALSQAVILVGAAILRSRRVRDLVMVLVPALSLGTYFAFQFFATRTALTHDSWTATWSGILLHPAWAYADAVPPGIAARSIGAASQGDYPVALVLLLALAAVCVATVYLAGWLVELVSAGHGVGGKVRRRAAREARPARTGRKAPTTRRARLPAVMAAMMDKEIKYLFREPYFKGVLVQTVLFLALGAFVFLRPWGTGGVQFASPRTMLWVVGGYALLSEGGVLLNLFGSEGKVGWCVGKP